MDFKTLGYVGIIIASGELEIHSVVYCKPKS